MSEANDAAAAAAGRLGSGVPTAAAPLEPFASSEDGPADGQASRTGLGDTSGAGSASTSSGAPPQVDAVQDEYALATSVWFSSAVDKVMRASDELYASLTHEQAEAMPEELVQPVGGGETIIVSPSSFTAAGVVTTDGIVDGKLGDVHVAVAETAEQMLAQVMAAMFARLNEVTDRTGNTVNAKGGLVEAFIEMVQKTEVRFDEDGQPAFTIAASPEMGATLRRELAESPDQARRLDAALAAKREEFNASRRRRRLPRHGH